MTRIVHSQLFEGTITLGLQKGYTEEVYPPEEVYRHLRELQETLIREKGVHLGANCYPSVLVLSGQQEPHLNLRFVYYPKFSLEEGVFKEAVEWIAESLMRQFEQNRLLVRFHDSTVMLEASPAIDPRIKTKEPL